MVKRVSLYFEPYAWEKMNRYLSLLLLSGKPIYDLPTMNDLIEGMVVYISRVMAGLEISTTDLMPYVEGPPAFISRTRLTNEQYNKGRIAFAVTPRLEEALGIIRVVSKKMADERIDPASLEGVSDPILIRSCVYYIVERRLGDFYENLYFSFLFGFRPEILSFNPDIYNPDKHKGEILNLTDIEKNNLRKVMWDGGVINALSMALAHETSSKDESTGFSLNFIRSGYYHSQGFNFDYFLAYVGFIASSMSYANDLSLPELIFDLTSLNLKETRLNYKFFIDMLTNIRKMSDDFNSSILDNKKQRY